MNFRRILDSSLNYPLEVVARLAQRNYLIAVISDFDGIGERTRSLIGGLARRNDVVLGVVTDPMAQDIPDNLRVVISDGDLQAEIDTGSATVRKNLSAASVERLQEVYRWQRQYGMPVLPISAGEETLPQVRRLMGHNERRP